MTFTGYLTAHCATRCTRNTTRQTTKLRLAHTYTVPTSTLPQSMTLQNTYRYHNLCAVSIHAQCVAQCWEQVSSGIRNYGDSDAETATGVNSPHSYAKPRHIRTTQVITRPQKLNSQLVGLVTAVTYQVAVNTIGFVCSMSLQSTNIIHNNLAGDAHTLFFHLRPPNQHTITGVDLCYKNFGRPWFT
jgi:hypothetical protein